MKKLTVIQHTSAEYLGLMEDHFEGRGIRFQYHRPFTENGKVPTTDIGAGLILLGGGPWGSAGARNAPSLADEIALTKACYMNGLPVIGIGLGAQIVSIACGGGSAPAPLTLKTGRATCTNKSALNGYLPKSFPHIVYMRDKPAPPPFAHTLAVDEDGDAAIFQIGENVFGFTGHPGTKRAIIEDLVMEFEEAVDNPGAALDTIGAMKKEIEDSLVSIMTGLIQTTELMRT